MINPRRSEEESDNLTGEMYTDNLSKDQRKLFEAGFEFASIIHDIVNQKDFAHPIMDENLGRAKQTLDDCGLMYSLTKPDGPDGDWFLSFMFEGDEDDEDDEDEGFPEYRDWVPGDDGSPEDSE